ncbi:MAG TPA: hypothetical protein VHD62_19250 [Opitutaceae bacterium]|nr:hypothetical protein [Opitutaceae bacterium]
MTALSSLGLLGWKIRSAYTEQKLLERRYPEIERLFTFYSLALWKHPNQEQPLVDESIHAISDTFRLQLPAGADPEMNGTRSVLFDAFKLPRTRIVEGEQIAGAQILGGDEMRSSFNWRSVFGYDMEVVVLESKLARLRAEVERKQEEIRRRENISSDGVFRFYEVEARLPAIDPASIRLHRFLISDGYLRPQVDGSAKPIHEWICYNDDGDFMTFGQLESAIAVALRKMGLADLDVARLAPQLEVRWLQRDEQMKAAITDALREIPEASKFEKFLDLAGKRQ